MSYVRETSPDKKSSAIFSTCGVYRYYLARRFEALFDHGDESMLCFFMLNPSTADVFQNDPTLERCERRARTLGFSGFEVLNLFGYRSTDPKGLLQVDDPVGADWDEVFNWWAEKAQNRRTTTVVGWGTHGVLFERDLTVYAKLSAYSPWLYQLAVNANGTPKHPLYCKNDAKLMIHVPREVVAV